VRGSDVRAWRHKYNVTGEDLARALNMHPSSLWRFERNDGSWDPCMTLAFERATMRLAILNNNVRMVAPDCAADAAVLHDMLMKHLAKMESKG
jgi:DNA-binding XRE family transcriptional regulator